MKVRNSSAGVRVAIAAVLLIAATLLWQQMPNKLQAWAPIAIDAELGERAVGRNLAVTVHSTQLAREVTFAAGSDAVGLAGFWVVSVVSYEPLLEPARPRFELHALGRNYTTSLDGFQTAINTQPGFTQRSVLAYELPEFPDRATLLAQNRAADQFGHGMNAPLDSEIRIPLSWNESPVATVDLDTAAEATR